jgi:H+/Cl- antiporter ClcA
MSHSLKSTFARERPNAFADSLTEHFRTARYVFLTAAPLGILVGLAIAAYDWAVNELLWKTFTVHCSPMVLCLLPMAAMVLAGAIMSIFRVKSSSMADEVVRAYHRPDQQIDYKSALPKLGPRWPPWDLAGAPAWRARANGWAGPSHPTCKARSTRIRV